MMQQRRMKRLAGPAFYLNVKYDQNLMYTQMNSVSALSGDKLGLNDQTGRIAYENFDIKEGELVFTKKVAASRSTTDAYVISSLNGANDIEDADLSKDDMKMKLVDKYKFLGVAQTEHVAKKQFEVDQGLVTCVGGVVTIQNDHSSTVHPGDMLVVDIPDKNKPIRGVPRTKKRFCLRPAEASGVTGLYEEKNDADTPKLDALQVALNAASAAITSLKGAGSAVDYQKAKPAANQALRDLMDALKLRTNYVAKALSHARSGERLDILLHPRFVA